MTGTTRKFFPTQVALYLVKIACERPDMMERSLSQWNCTRIRLIINFEQAFSEPVAVASGSPSLNTFLS